MPRPATNRRLSQLRGCEHIVRNSGPRIQDNKAGARIFERCSTNLAPANTPDDNADITRTRLGRWPSGCPRRSIPCWFPRSFRLLADIRTSNLSPASPPSTNRPSRRARATCENCRHGISATSNPSASCTSTSTAPIRCARARSASRRWPSAPRPTPAGAGDHRHQQPVRRARIFGKAGEVGDPADHRRAAHGRFRRRAGRRQPRSPISDSSARRSCCIAKSEPGYSI